MSAQRIVFCTMPDTASAEKLAAKIVEAKLAACVNLIPGLTSLYMWDNKLNKGTEVLLMIKTTTQAYAALEQHIHSGHPYELPEIISVPIDAGLPAYLQWITDNSTVTL